MEVDPDGSDIDQLSEVSLTVDQEVQGPINAYGSPIGANSRVLHGESATVIASVPPSTSQNINRVVRILRNQLRVPCYQDLLAVIFWFDQRIFHRG